MTGARMFPRFNRVQQLLLLLVAWLLAASVVAAECDRPARLRFSMVPQSDVRADLNDLLPLFADLQLALKMPVEIVNTSSYGSVVEGMLAGQIDLARLGPAAYVLAKRQDAAITAFASVVRAAPGHPDGTGFYHSVLIVRNEGPYTSVESLRGRRVALVDPDSTSGALIPRHVFAKIMKKPLEQYFSQLAYSGGHDQSIVGVQKGQVDAAFVSSTELQQLEEKSAGQDDRFAPVRVLWRSSAIPRNPYVFRGRLCADIKEKITNVFLGHNGSANKALMRSLGVMRFVPVSDQDYQVIRDLY